MGTGYGQLGATLGGGGMLSDILLQALLGMAEGSDASTPEAAPSASTKGLNTKMSDGMAPAENPLQEILSGLNAEMPSKVAPSKAGQGIKQRPKASIQNVGAGSGGGAGGSLHDAESQAKKDAVKQMIMKQMIAYLFAL